mmetsp:Transcript_30722/g.91074  ORF Transcript_30722/g.91074 Transcript_30722/m.91074 type:complete len:205 (+) Transcript_30722:2979-3593(+)
MCPHCRHHYYAGFSPERRSNQFRSRAAKQDILVAARKKPLSQGLDVCVNSAAHSTLHTPTNPHRGSPANARVASRLPSLDVCSGSGRGVDDARVLPRDCIDRGRLSRVHDAKHADVDALHVGAAIRRRLQGLHCRRRRRGRGRRRGAPERPHGLAATEQPTTAPGVDPRRGVEQGQASRALERPRASGWLVARGQGHGACQSVK